MTFRVLESNNNSTSLRYRILCRCQSSIGRDGGEQTISIGPACLYQGVIMHEMTHAMGFFHEKNRWDRDSCDHPLEQHTGG
ncbi:hypothetical protein DPMN_069368 [Dreissena polymorpha]|uniref:Metalloendopeptidase n=1 Tax=Dreissena polymorpha TaxID=45954 RepID=A0A9D3YZD0_DREPO|nr:hypothetical protein DPMN_069368 [Dreissena polymorpha]